MKMAALQLMQQKANRDASRNEKLAAITQASETEASADATQTTASDSGTLVSTDGPVQMASGEETPSKAATNGPMEPAATQNGECKNPLEGKELEESIPGLAQAKELAETLVAEDGSGIGTSKKKKCERLRQLLWWIVAKRVVV